MAHNLGSWKGITTSALLNSNTLLNITGTFVAYVLVFHIKVFFYYSFKSTLILFTTKFVYKHQNRKVSYGGAVWSQHCKDASLVKEVINR
jgi:hypothetical protein